MVNKFSGNSDSDEKKLWPSLNTLNGQLRSAVVPVPELTPLLHVSLVTRRSSPVAVVLKMCVAS